MLHMVLTQVDWELYITLHYKGSTFTYTIVYYCGRQITTNTNDGTRTT